MHSSSSVWEAHRNLELLGEPHPWREKLLWPGMLGADAAGCIF